MLERKGENLKAKVHDMIFWVLAKISHFISPEWLVLKSIDSNTNFYENRFPDTLPTLFFSILFSIFSTGSLPKNACGKAGSSL
jgi:hypothetical protein